MKSIREEDIYSINERTRNVYVECFTKEICERECECFNNQIIIPLSIGNNNFKRKLNNKMYISEKDNCAICVGKMDKKKEAYLTDCGHCFHKKCLTEYIEHQNKTTNKNIKCPICRSNLGYPEIYKKYNMYNEETNGLDLLENFNYEVINYDLIHLCKSGNKYPKHYLGINKECKECLRYRKNGFIK